MSVLGTMMLRAGLLSEGQVAAADDQAASASTSHVDAILQLGLADEDTLVAFLASKLMIPRVRNSVLERIDQQTVQRLPPVLAWDHKCLAISADELGNLTVAMADPTDPRAIEAISSQTGAYLVRAVASASDIRRALERHLGPEQAVRQHAAAAAAAPVVPAPAPVPVPVPVSVPEVIPEPAAASPAAPYMTAAASVPPSSDPSGLGILDDDDDVPVYAGHAAAEEINSSPHEREPAPPADPSAHEAVPAPAGPAEWGPPPAAAVHAPAPPAPATPSPAPAYDDPHTRPTIVETQTPQSASPPSASPQSASRGPRRARAHTPWNPPLAGRAPDAVVPLSPEAFAEVLPELEAATDRDEVTTLLLDFLGAGFERVILFVHSHNEVKGLDARGKDLLVEAVRQVRIPTTGPSMFSAAIERSSPYLGPAQNTTAIDNAFSQALGGVKGNVLLLPITLGSKVPLVLWAHGTNHPVDPRSINELSAAVSTAIMRIIAAARRR